MKTSDSIIMSQLLNDRDYAESTINYIEADYFSGEGYKKLFPFVAEFHEQYGITPSKDELTSIVEAASGFTSYHLEKMRDAITESFNPPTINSTEWLMQQTEEFCTTGASTKIILECASRIDRGEEIGELIDKLREASQFSFDRLDVTDFRKSIAARADRINAPKEARIPFDIHVLNSITNGGLKRKTLNVIAAGTGAGKSLFMVHHAVSLMRSGYNVLYVSMEMGESEILKRADANVLDVNINDIDRMSPREFLSRQRDALSDNDGWFVVKEYPTCTASISHFRRQLVDLKRVRGVYPDVLFVDYLNICASSRLRMSDANSYLYVKAIAEELRSLAQEFDLPIVTATQFNREGMVSSDVNMSNISDSAGISMTADLLLAMIRSEELDDAKKVMFKQLKNRYGDMTDMLKFCVGVDRSKMKLFNCDTEIPISTQYQRRNSQ